MKAFVVKFRENTDFWVKKMGEYFEGRLYDLSNYYKCRRTTILSDERKKEIKQVKRIKELISMSNNVAVYVNMKRKDKIRWMSEWLLWQDIRNCGRSRV